MKRVQITMEHTEESVRRLAKVQYDTFSVHTKLFWYAACLVAILLGFGLIVDLGEPLRYVPLAFGCVAIVNIGASGRVRAEKTLEAIRRQGRFPRTAMTFTGREIQIREETGGETVLEYGSLYRLVEDGAYFYLFLNRTAAYMVPKEQLEDEEAFRRLLEEKSGRTFRRPASLLKLRLSTLRGLGKQ